MPLSVPDFVRSDLALVTQDYERVLSYTPDTDGRASAGGKRIFLPHQLRIKGQALLALGGIRKAGKTLTDARAIDEAQGSRRALWPILFEMGRVAVVEGNHHESERLIEESRDMVNYMADHCGSIDSSPVASTSIVIQEYGYN